MQVGQGRLWMLGTLVAFALSAPSVAAAAPTLGHDNWVTASRPGYVEVELPQQIGPFDGSDSEHPLMSWDFDGGQGWLRHGVLRSEQPGPDGQPIALWFERYDGESETGKWTLWWAIVWGSDRLPAGLYRFYVITNATTPTRARLSFRDLSGGTDLTTDTPVPFTERPLPVTGIGINKFGATDAIGASGGAAFLSLRTDATTPSADRLEYCLYPGGDEKAGTQAYDRGCPGGQSSSDLLGITTLSAPSKGENTGLTLVDAQPGRIGIGGNATVGGVPPKFDVHAAWMSWNDQLGALPLTTPASSPGVIYNAPDGTTATNAPEPAQRALAPAVLASKRATVKGGRARIPLRCARGSSGCSGRLRIGTGRFTKFALPAGAREVTRPLLSRRLQRTIARRGRASARVEVYSQLGSGVIRQMARVSLVPSP